MKNNFKIFLIFIIIFLTFTKITSNASEEDIYNKIDLFS